MMTNISEFENKIEPLQKAFCLERETEYMPALTEMKSGLALSTRGLTPMNGLRHPAEDGTTGWYIWFGEHFSSEPDFFAPIHTSHIYEDYPEFIKLLGLPPGYRFLLAEGDLDVWYDATLLDI
jgi:hypothetical protein